VLNASKFVLSPDAIGATTADLDPAAVTSALDLSMLSGLRQVIDEATDALDEYDYTTALETAERFFWTFCDDYLELVKERAYGDGSDAHATQSAKSALALALSVQLRLLAPYLPYATEEVWSWWQDGSVHRAAWPSKLEIGAPADGDATMLDAVAAALAGIRGAKSQAKVSMRAELSHVEVFGPAALLVAAKAAADDLRKVGRITGDLVFTAQLEATELTVAAELAAQE
jgi:valyl-tRNA synthetase